MQGDKQVIAYLNAQLKLELTGHQPVLPARPDAEELGPAALGQA